MGMPVHTRKFTADELADFPDDGNRYEVIDGELFVTPAPRLLHQRVLKLLVRHLDGHAEACGLELFFAPTAVRSSPLTEVQPDLLVFSGSMTDVEDGRRIKMSSLWLAVEILSPSTERLDRVRKRKAYLDGGVREYWIVDSKARAVEVWKPSQPVAHIARGSLAWRPVPARDLLMIDLDALFRDVHREG